MVTKLGTRKRKVSLSASYDWKTVETKVRKFYDSTDVHALLEKRLRGKKPLGYVEGPPTLNAQPHVGHVRGRIYKDLYFRRSALEGKRVVFRGGWDTQGLPVELQAEKDLGLTGNKWENLSRVGVDKLVEACKSLVLRVKKEWIEADRLLGVSLDQKHAYMTYRDAYIEREWKYLETAWKRGLLGEGFKVVPYCPSCQTALSHAEVSLGGYESLEDPSLYYKVRTEDGSYLLVWTTMPFTVVTDEMVAVKPDADYERVSVGTEDWMVCSSRREALESELGLKLGPAKATMKGRDLEGMRYVHPLLSEIPGLAKLKSGKVHTVVARDFVDTTTGTGLVHLAPANGEDDFEAAQELGLPVFAPFDDQVRFTEDAGKFAGLFARDADEMVVSRLRESGALVKAGRLVHDYPVCWRSGHRIVWLARREYFYWVDRIRPELVKAAEKVEYFFEAPKNRYLEFIRESPPWGITRERIWGTPLPVWACESCGEKTGVFTRKRILELAVELPDGRNFELHRPWIDRVLIRCPKCGGDAKREPFVLDTWHNSGASPYAAFSDSEYKALFPSAFQTEAIDQTRGWAYTLLVQNVILAGKPQAPYRSFLFQGFVLDDRGRKMSKSLGNVVQGLDLLRGNSADVTRFYFAWKGSPEDSLNLDLRELNARPYQVLNTLHHLHLYLVQNGTVDGYDPVKNTVEWARRRRLLAGVDKWLLSKAAGAEKEAADAYASGRYNEVCKLVEDLVITSVSQTYVRLVRPELWRDEPKERERRLAVFAVLGHVLKVTDQLLHPVSPFLTEYLYQEVFASRGWKAPLMTERRGLAAGKPSPEWEEAVDFALSVEAGCNSARTKAKLKRRWPLRSVMVLVPKKDSPAAGRAKSIVKSLCNVRKADFVTEATEFPAEFELRANRGKVGVLFKERSREVLERMETMKGERAVASLWSGKPVAVKLSSGTVEVPSDALELVVIPERGFEVARSGDYFVGLDSHRDEDLVAEGLVRDVARRLQALRKTRGFVPTAVLRSAAIAGLDAEDLRLLSARRKEIAFLVRVRTVELFPTKVAKRKWEEEDLDGRPIFLYVG